MEEHSTDILDELPLFPLIDGARSPVQLLKASDCAALLRISVGAWYDWCKYDPSAPKPFIKAGEEKSAPSYWLLSDVEAYIRLLAREQRTGYIADAHRKRYQKKRRSRAA